jgi:hypothetical protein
VADFPLGRLEPTDDQHILQYPLTTMHVALPDEPVERTLSLPHSMRAYMDQNEEGACVGGSLSWHQSINNRRRYAFFWLYDEAQKIDEWPGEDYDGTSIRAGMDVLRDIGHCLVLPRRTCPPDVTAGISENRWAKNVDMIRATINAGSPVVLGINWYRNFDDPFPRRRGAITEHWIGVDGAGQPTRNLGIIRGGHAICCYGASDKRQAFKLVNTWGLRYPLVWLPYETMNRLFGEHGEATMATDRIV